jgi:hypothetical protein
MRSMNERCVRQLFWDSKKAFVKILVHTSMTLHLSTLALAWVVWGAISVHIYSAMLLMSIGQELFTHRKDDNNLSCSFHNNG